MKIYDSFKTFVYGVETSIYVHLSEERGYYLVFRLGEHAVLSETNTATGTVFIAVATWIAQYIVGGVVGADRSHGDGRGRTSTRALSLLTATYHGVATRSHLLNNTNCNSASVSSSSLIYFPLFEVAASATKPSWPIATVVYLHFAVAIRRVVGYGGREGSKATTTWHEYTTALSTCNELSSYYATARVPTLELISNTINNS